MTAPQTSDTDKPHRGRRLTWEEFRRLTGREPPKAANDNDKNEGSIRECNGGLTSPTRPGTVHTGSYKMAATLIKPA